MKLNRDGVDRLYNKISVLSDFMRGWDSKEILHAFGRDADFWAQASDHLTEALEALDNIEEFNK